MNAVVIEHVPLADLPLAWRDKLPKAKFARKSHVTVRIEQEEVLPSPGDKEQAALTAVMANPMTAAVWAFVIVLGRLIAYDYVWGSWSPAQRQ